jgi:hypothetical protein
VYSLSLGARLCITYVTQDSLDSLKHLYVLTPDLGARGSGGVEGPSSGRGRTGAGSVGGGGCNKDVAPSHVVLASDDFPHTADYTGHPRDCPRVCAGGWCGGGGGQERCILCCRSFAWVECACQAGIRNGFHSG